VVGTREDLELEIRSLRAERDRSQSAIDRLTGMVDRLTTANEKLADKVAALVEEVTALRAELARSRGQSPETPSGQVPPYTKPLRAACGRVPGRRKGHPGSCRKPPEEPDREEDHTLERGPHCQGPVHNVRNAGFERVCRFRYVEDVVPGTPEVSKHNIQQCRCRGCKRMEEAAVTAALPGAHLGLQAMVRSAVQHCVCGRPAAKIVTILRQDYGFLVSEGGPHACWHQLSAFLDFKYEAIIDKVRLAGALHADETGWRIHGSTGWLWCFATAREIGCFIDRRRSSSVATRILRGYCGGTLIQDFYAAYHACNAAGTQDCLAHVLREFKEIEARDGPKVTAAFKRFRDQVTRIIRKAIEFHRNCTDPPAREAACQRFERRLLEVLEEPTGDKNVGPLVKRIWRSAPGMVTFLTTDGVEPTNNHAEKQIRPAVFMRKISGGSRSEHGVDTRAILTSVFRTQQLQGLNPTKATIDLAQHRIVTLHATKKPRGASRGQPVARRSAWEFADVTTTSVRCVRAGAGLRHKTGARASAALYERAVIPA
jgi:transposase